MAILYLTEQQAWVGREGECLIVHIPERDEQGKPLGKRERKMTVPLFIRCRIDSALELALRHQKSLLTTRNFSVNDLRLPAKP